MHFLDELEDDRLDSLIRYDVDGYFVYAEPEIKAEKDTVTIGLNNTYKKEKMSFDGINRYP